MRWDRFGSLVVSGPASLMLATNAITLSHALCAVTQSSIKRLFLESNKCLTSSDLELVISGNG